MGKRGGLPLKTGFLAFWGCFLIDLKSVALKNRVFYRAGSKIGFVQRSHNPKNLSWITQVCATHG
jgi:hypothetical protein